MLVTQSLTIIRFSRISLQPLPGGARKRPGGIAIGSGSEDYRVILHRGDGRHEVSCVAAMLTEIISALQEPRAIMVAEKAFTTGQAEVIVCAKATAQRYCNQLTRQYELIVTLEAVA